MIKTMLPKIVCSNDERNQRLIAESNDCTNDKKQGSGDL